jgi:hypothetical protein
MSEKAYLDVTIFKCPECGISYAEASWYAIEIASDIECGKCHQIFNPLTSMSDRVTVEFALDSEGRVKELKKFEKKNE